MIIFESILTSFELSSIFQAAGAVAEISLSLKLNHRKQIQLSQNDETHCTYIFCSRFDAREKSLLSYATHYSNEAVFGQRATMRVNLEKGKAILGVEHLQVSINLIFLQVVITWLSNLALKNFFGLKCKSSICFILVGKIPDLQALSLPSLF